jgi:chromosome partitioning protein
MAAAAAVYAVTNQKGGSCKTTTAINLAAEYAARGKRVLLVDLDPQGNAGTSLGAPPTDGAQLVAAIVDGAVMPVVDTAAGVSLVQSGRALARIDRLLAGEPGAETLLRHALRRVPGRWDLVLLDCPPTLGLMSHLALTAAQSVIVPVYTEAAPLEGVATLLDTLEQVRARLNPQLSIAAVIGSRTTNTRLSRDVEAALRARFGPAMCKTVIRQNVKISESYSHGAPIRLYAPDSAGAQDFAALAAELIRRKAVH